MAFGDQVDKLVKMDVAGVPIGRGAYFAAGRGLSQAVIDLLENFGVPPALSGISGAWAVNNVRGVRRVFGDVGSYDLSAIMAMESINNQFDLSTRINDLVSNVTAMLPGGGGGNTAGLTSGYSAPAPAMPAPSRPSSTGQLPSATNAPSLDLYDEFMESRHAE